MPVYAANLMEILDREPLPAAGLVTTEVEYLVDLHRVLRLTIVALFQ
jgi:hypothetical protein